MRVNFGFNFNHYRYLGTQSFKSFIHHFPSSNGCFVFQVFILFILIYLMSETDRMQILVQRYNIQCKYNNIFAKESSRSDWGSNPRPTATPPSTKYQRSNPLSQIAILKKNGSLDSGIQAWYLSIRHVANSGELLYTQCFFKHCISILFRVGEA
jgi:hypothetical protein